MLFNTLNQLNIYISATQFGDNGMIYLYIQIRDQSKKYGHIFRPFLLNMRLNLCQFNSSLKTCSFYKAGPLWWCKPAQCSRIKWNISFTYSWLFADCARIQIINVWNFRYVTRNHNLGFRSQIQFGFYSSYMWNCTFSPKINCGFWLNKLPCLVKEKSNTHVLSTDVINYRYRVSLPRVITFLIYILWHLFAWS